MLRRDLQVPSSVRPEATVEVNGMLILVRIRMGATGAIGEIARQGRNVMEIDPQIATTAGRDLIVREANRAWRLRMLP